MLGYNGSTLVRNPTNLTTLTAMNAQSVAQTGTANTINLSTPLVNASLLASGNPTGLNAAALYPSLHNSINQSLTSLNQG